MHPELASRELVSIRFEVRGGFRPTTHSAKDCAANSVSIRFEVRGGFRRVLIGSVAFFVDAVSIRFEVRGGFRRHSKRASGTA